MGDQPEIWKAAAMADHFDKIQKLPDPVPGVPNFRRVPGYKVYCCGQPTLAGVKACLEKVTGTIYKVNIEKNNIMEFYKSPKNMYWIIMLSFSRYTL